MAKDRDKYRSLTVTADAYREVLTMRDELLDQGLTSLPPEFRPQDGPAITVSVVVSAGIAALRQQMKARRR